MQWHTFSQTHLVDEPVVIKIEGLPVCKKIKIKASSLDRHNQPWSAEADYLTDSEGKLDLCQQAPLSGSYKGIDSQGLFWSMRPAKHAKIKALFEPTGCQPIKIQLHLFQGKQLLGCHEIERHFYHSDVQRIEVQEQDIAGILYLPGKQQNCPALLLISGIHGVQSVEGMAALLASKGYAVFILAYQTDLHATQNCCELPLEHFRRGIQWLKQHEQVDAARVAAMGISKGAEALLATLAYLPDNQLKAVIAQAPTHVVWQGVGEQGLYCKSSWTLFNGPLHYLSLNQSRLGLEAFKQQCLAKFTRQVALRMAKFYRLALKNKRREDEARIPIENIQAPLLLISGGHDLLWPSCEMSEAIKQYLQQKNLIHPVTHWNFPGAGHGIRYPGLPTTVQQWVLGDVTLALGGEAAPAALANQQYWSELVTYLQANV